MYENIGGLFLLVKGYYIEKQGLAMRLGKGGGAAYGNTPNCGGTSSPHIKERTYATVWRRNAVRRRVQRVY